MPPQIQLPLLLACINSLQELMRTSADEVDFSQRTYVVSEDRDELKSILDDVLQKKSWRPLSVCKKIYNCRKIVLENYYEYYNNLSPN